MTNGDRDQHTICAALAAEAVMIDKTGNSDTHSKLLSGSGSLQMKSDGLPHGFLVYDFGDGFNLERNKLISGVDKDDSVPHA